MHIIKKYYRHTIMMILVLACVLPFLGISFFAFPYEDDFNYAIYGRQLSGPLTEQIAYAAKRALNEAVYGGLPLIHFFYFLISPLSRFGIMGVRISIFSMNVLFLLSVLVLVKWIVNGIFKDKSRLHWLVAYLLFVLCFIAIKSYREAFTWVSGAFGYELPVICLFWGLTFFIKATILSKKRF